MADRFQESTVAASGINLMSSIGNALIVGLVFLVLVSLALPEQLGTYVGILFVGELGVVVAVMGVNEAATWRVARLFGMNQESRVRPAIRGILMTTLVLALLVSFCIALASDALSYVFLKSTDAGVLFLVISVGVVFHSIGTTSFGVLMGQHRIRAYSMMSFLAVLTGQLAGLFLFYLERDVLALAVGWTIGGVIHMMTFLGLGILKKDLKAAELPDRTLVLYSLSVFVGHLMLFLSKWIDRSLLLVLVPAHDVGVYSVPLMVWTFASYITMSLYVSLVPKLARISEEGNSAGFAGMLRTGMSILVLALTALSIMIFPLARPILLVFAGPQYTSGVTSLQILSLGFPFQGMSFILSGALKVQGKARIAAICVFAGILSALITGLLLIPIFGITGAALSNTIGQIVGSACAAGAIRLTTRNWLDPRPIGLLLLSAIPVFILLVIGSPYISSVIGLLFLVCAALALEVVLLRVLGVVTPAWIDLLDGVFPTKTVLMIRKILIG